jgi:hypothetical protein
MPPDQPTQVDRQRAHTDGWVTVQAPGQQGQVYLQAGDELKLTFEPDDEEDHP